MQSRLSFFSTLTALLISTFPSSVFAESDQAAPNFTLQVASFPDTAQAGRFAVGLVSAGQNPACDTVEIEGRGSWTRVFVGLFDTKVAAQRYGVTLIARGIIREFLIKKADPILTFTRPRRVASGDSRVSTKTGRSEFSTKSKVLDKATGSGSAAHFQPVSGILTEARPIHNERGLSTRVLRDHVSTPLPIVETAAFRLAPRFDTNLIPRPDPVDLAFRLVTGEVRSGPGAPGQRGGLWITGDSGEALARLRWIVGEQNVGLIELDADGRVRFDNRLLAKAAQLGVIRVEDPLRAVDYISSNEGLLLIVQLGLGRYRYLLHIGRQAPTYGKSVETSGSINLDNNADSRINPYRKNGKKLDGERPPEGFDSLIALNPVARWFNLTTNCWVQSGEIVFHELAEAYAKLELGLDYLDLGSRPGAHAHALERELRLKSQRPDADIVMTAGSNRLLRTKEEIRLFYAEAAGVTQR